MMELHFSLIPVMKSWPAPGQSWHPGIGTSYRWLEKEHITGNVSYDPENHEFMVKLRQKKVDLIADYIPEQEIDNGPHSGKILVLGWGSTYGAIKSAVAELVAEGHKVAHAHLRYLRPFPRNLGKLLKKYDKILVPELNNGQLVKIIRSEFLVDAIGLNKIKGLPFTKSEILAAVHKML